MIGIVNIIFKKQIKKKKKKGIWKKIKQKKNKEKKGLSFIFKTF
jgi:hypothetical protein